MLDVQYKGWLIEPQSYESDAGWRPRALLIFSTGGSTYEHRLPAALYEMHETEEQANIYSLRMAKKWIDDRG